MPSPEKHTGKNYRDPGDVLQASVNYALDAKGDVHAVVEELLVSFGREQTQLLRHAVQLRFPVGAYLRDALGDVHAARIESRLRGAHAANIEEESAAAKRAILPRALETRDDILKSGESAAVGETRMNNLLKRHALLNTACERFEEIQRLATGGEPEALRAAEDAMVSWWSDTLNCSAYLHMVGLVIDPASIPFPPNSDVTARAAIRGKHRQLLATARRCEDHRVHLVRLYDRLVAGEARQRKNDSVGAGFEDCFSYGMIGLQEAVDRFVPGRSNFTSFARDYIQLHIRRAISDAGNLVSVPDNVRDNLSRVTRYIHDQMATGRSAHEITESEILANVAGEGGAPLTRVALQKALAVPTVTSLDEEIRPEDSEQDDGEKPSHEHAGDVQDARESVEAKEHAAAIESVIRQNTTPAERLLLALKTGYGASGGLQEAAKEFLDGLVESSGASTQEHLKSAERFPKNHHLASMDILVNALPPPKPPAGGRP